MVGAEIQNIFMGFVKLSLLTGAVLYAGLVLMNYRAKSLHRHPQVDWRDPAHAAERWAVWMGVVGITLAVRVASPVFGMLSEASADVGDWFLSHRHHESH